MKRPTVLLSHVWHYMVRSPDEMFVFKDKKACIVYYVPFHTVLYLIGDFAGGSDEVTTEVHRAAVAMTN